MALFDEKDEGLVKAFLLNKIEREYDADPGTMADYVMVTLQNDMSEGELKAHCKNDLTEFLGDKTNGFVDTLFDALATRQYLPRTQLPQKPEPVAQRVSEASLSIKGAGSRNSGSRGDSWENGDRYSARRRSRSPAHDRHRRTREGRSSSRERRVDREPHHPVDAAVMDMPLDAAYKHMQQQQQQQQQQMPQQMSQQQMPQQRRRKPCFEFMRRGKCQRGDGCTFAHVSGDQAQMMGMRMPPTMAPGGPMGGQFMMGPGGPMGGQFMMGPGGPMGMPPAHGQQQQPPMAPQQMHQQDYSTTGVFVASIPTESLSEAAVREFFARFGTIAGVLVDYTKQCATVVFADEGAQMRAINSPEAPFNNRFVRVFKAYSSAVERTAERGQRTESQQQQQAPVWRPKSAAIKKAEMIEKYVEQQKELMKKLTTTKDMPPATRKIIMDSIKQIQQKIAETQTPKPAGAANEGAAPKPDQELQEQQQPQPQLDAVASEKAELQSKLKALQEEAVRLGMNARRATAPRGRGGWAGGQTGGRAAMTLDKRPRTLVLRNVGQEAAELLPAELGRFGEIEHIDKLDDQPGPPFAYTVKYRARWEAEKAVKAVGALELFADVSVDWDQQ
ncbi:hypothetical protein H4R19_000336 [Coemansia spiralis]|nr:hypothetical protein H4R19_000336 [Coemansia spiralis]